jgi:hypothetical protein
MKSSEPVYGRPGPVGSDGRGANHTSGRAERSAGVGWAEAGGDGASEADGNALSIEALGTGAEQAAPMSAAATPPTSQRVRFLNLTAASRRDPARKR